MDAKELLQAALFEAIRSGDLKAIAALSQQIAAVEGK